MRTREIKLGALYDLNGVVCRAKRKLQNNTFLMSHHKRFFTFAKAPELKKIGAGKVNKYLLNK